MILAKWIDANWKQIGANGDNIHAFPVIIENILDSNELQKRGLKANLAEEILSRISYATYVFLDTMSSAYEYGQFSNYAYKSNLVRVFLDNEYESRVLCRVGAYLSQNAEKLTTYQAQYNGSGFIFFQGDSIPSEIISAISNDNPLSAGYKKDFKILFSTKDSYVEGIGCFSVLKKANTITFSSDAKTWFYFMSAVRRRRNRDLSQIFSPNDSNYLSFLREVKIDLFRSFLASRGIFNNISVLYNRINVGIECLPFPRDAFPYYVAVLLGLISSTSGGASSLKSLSASPGVNVNAMPTINTIDFFLPENCSLVAKVRESLDCITHGVSSKTLTIHGKKRNLVCYGKDKYGRDLRKLHESIGRFFLSELPTSTHSYAYKKGENSLSCLKRHEGNDYFAKFDIKDFFNSITLNAFLDRMTDLISDARSVEREAQPALPVSMKEIRSEIRELLWPLFFNGRLPLGYVNSPKISDFYLFTVDEKMGRVDEVTYTRYADDILLSSKSEDKLNEAVLLLRKLISEQNLVINESKTMRKKLAVPGDYIRFLGVNLVRREKRDEYTISRSYLVSTSKMIAFGDKKRLPSYDLKVLGRINYIKFVSKSSYLKLLRLVEIKLGFPNRYFKNAEFLMK